MIDPNLIVCAEITHSNIIALADNSHFGKIIPTADGLITKEKNIYLSVTSADCLPIFLFDPKKEVTGIIHAGWRGLANAIIPNEILKMTILGSTPKDILVGIGPAICQKHYEVGFETAKNFKNYPGAIEKYDGKIFLDIKKIAELQLMASGLSEKNIEISPECTFELPDKYFSFRRDKPREPEAMMAVIGMKI